MLTLLKDLRHGLRTLRKTPLFTTVALATLALGIGTNTAIFSIVNAVLLRPFPVERPDRLVFLNESSTQRSLTQQPVSPANYLDWKAQSRSYSGMSAFTFVALTYTASAGAGASRWDGSAVTPDFFKVIGIEPFLGRDFLPEDAQPGGPAVVLISESLWRDAFAGDSRIVGRTVRLDSRAVTVIGVVRGAEDVLGGLQFKAWVPLAFDAVASQDRVSQFYGVLARLKDGVTAAAAQAEMRGIAKNLERQYPNTNNNWSVTSISFNDNVVGFARTRLMLMLSAVSLVLLIGCVNLASLFSARMSARQREVATRVALGATRGRLIRQFLSESVLLGLFGGALGILLAFWSLPLLVSAIPQGLLPRVQDVGLDAATLAYTLVVSFAAGLLFGISPALHATKTDINNILKEQSRGSSGSAKRTRLRDALVIAEIALSMILLVGAGLLLRSFIALRNVDPGFKIDKVLVNTQLVLPQEKYDTTLKRLEFFSRLLERVRALPGARSAGGITALPLQGNSQVTGFSIVGQPPAMRGELAAVHNIVTDGYFESMGIPLRKGRLFSNRDDGLAPKVALINEALAVRNFKGRDPIGQHVMFPGKDSQPLEVAGVVGNSRQFGLAAEPSPEIFTPFLQSNASFMYLLVRTAGDPEQLAIPIRREVAAIDPDQPVGHRTLAGQLGNSIAQPRFLSTLLGLFAALALLLALVGIYGVTSYGVAQRTQEIGIRMALGARPAGVMRLVLLRTLGLATAGIAIGAAAALALGRLIANLLYGVTPSDPLTFLNVAAALAVVAILASFIPARRAARLDATIAMRQD